jgi:uncharacterized membrane protein
MSNMQGANSKSALGMDGNITALLGYIVGIIAIVSAIIEKDNRFVRFHAFQAIFYTVGFIIIYFVLAIVLGILTAITASMSSTLGMLFGLLFTLVVGGAWLVFIAGIIYAAIKSYGGNYFKLPIIGNLAESIAGK